MTINLNYMFAGYVEAIEFTDMAEGDDCARGKFAVETSEQFKIDCAAFVASIPEALMEALGEVDKYDDVQMGRDFWFTRNGHGAGFWDREKLSRHIEIPGLPFSLGEALSSLAHKFSQVDLYVGDDGLIYA